MNFDEVKVSFLRWGLFLEPRIRYAISLIVLETGIILWREAEGGKLTVMNYAIGAKQKP